jgi:hypothetical protein
LEATRAAAFQRARQLAEAHPQHAGLVAALDAARDGRHTAAGRAFVFMATLAVAVPRGKAAGAAAALPPEWLAALHVPSDVATAKLADIHGSAALAVTLPAFSTLAKEAALPIVAGQPVA